MGEYLAHVEAAFSSARRGTVVDLKPRVLELARIFSGNDPAHPPVKGYHGFTLPAKLQADLGPFWAAHRAEWGDDAVAVLFDWLGALTLEACRKADGDDDLLGSLLKEPARYAVGVLLGTEAREIPA